MATWELWAKSHHRVPGSLVCRAGLPVLWVKLCAGDSAGGSAGGSAGDSAGDNAGDSAGAEEALPDGSPEPVNERTDADLRSHQALPSDRRLLFQRLLKTSPRFLRQLFIRSCFPRYQSCPGRLSAERSKRFARETAAAPGGSRGRTQGGDPLLLVLWLDFGGVPLAEAR